MTFDPRAGAEAGLRMRLAANPSPMTLDGTRTYLVGRRRPIVVDPGPADGDHLAAIHDALAGHTPVAILLTHHHPDHAAGAPGLAAATNAPVCMAPGARDVGFAAVRVDRWIGEGDVFETDSGAVHALATPGHAPEHFAFLWDGPAAPARGALIVGDLFMGVGDTTLIASPEGDLGAYLVSLRRVAELRPGVLLPGHGPPLDDALATVERYRHHRAERLRRLLEVLRASGPLRPAELVGPVYGAALDPRLAAAAEASLRAMLQFLDRRGQVQADAGDRFAARPDDDSQPDFSLPPSATKRCR